MQAYSFGCKAALHGNCTSCCSDLSSPSHQLTVMAGPSVTPALHPARTGTRPRTAAMGSRAAALRALKLARSQAPEEEHEDHKATGSHLDCSARMHLEPLDWNSQCFDVRCGVLRRGQAGLAYLKKVWKETKDLGGTLAPALRRPAGRDIGRLQRPACLRPRCCCKEPPALPVLRRWGPSLNLGAASFSASPTRAASVTHASTHRRL